MKPKRERLYGWTDGNVYYLSVSPREQKPLAANQYPTQAEAAAEAGKRRLPVEWEEGIVRPPEEIG